MEITPYEDERYAEVVGFITRLNEEPAHRIGYIGETREDVIHDLGDLSVPLREGFRLADEDGRLVGVLGYDADLTLGRVWLMGPFVDHPDWQTIADQLYDEICRTLPSELTQHELFGHTDNQLLAEFALAHCFDALPETHLLEIGRPLIPSGIPDGIVTYDATFGDQFAALHAATFPSTYYSAEQLVDLQDERRHLLLATDQNRLLGYAFVQTMPDIQQAYLDFIGVAEGQRRTGIGRRLLQAVMAVAFRDPAIDRLHLTVNSDNSAAYQLYQSFGFETVQSLRGYRTRALSGNGTTPERAPVKAASL